ncbi:MAG: glycosyltransferase family 2 protein [Mycoplasmataceae bacterium]|nr:glycosyltransferase family 2 protein [Mycoplasmataceae bacterium]
MFLTYFFRWKITIELLEILKNNKLPKKLPKVVSVYTTHNDFWAERLLQTMQQNYSNIEYWISDGSSNLEISKKIREFAKKHKINYHYLNRPSTNKADNLNHFLKNSGAKFDYLLIQDADVAIDKNFVKTSLVFFNSKNQKRLGWVSSMMQNFKTNNLFANNLMHSENRVFVFDHFYTNFIMSNEVNLYSSACLIKKEMLKEFDLLFPDSCLEDAWLEMLATKKYWVGLINPFAISMQAYDNSILNSFTRIYRVIDWGLKFYKEYFFKNQNETKRTFYRKYFNESVIKPYRNIFLVIVTSILVFLLVNYWKEFISYKEYQILLICFCISFFVNFICSFFKSFLFLKWKSISFTLFYAMYNFSAFWYSFYRYVKAFYFSKYADFSPTRSTTNNKNNKWINLKKVKNFIYLFIVFTILLLVFDLNFVFFDLYNKNLYLSFIFIFINVLVGSMWFSQFCFLFLYSLTFIKTNKKYKKEDFVFCTDKFVKQDKLIDNWCKKENITREQLFSLD